MVSAAAPGALERTVLYRPANSTEGARFMARWCGRCRHEEPDADAPVDWTADEWRHACTIAEDAMCFRVTDPEYPAEWRQDGPSGPRCTAFDPVDPMDQPLDPAAAVRLLL